MVINLEVGSQRKVEVHKTKVSINIESHSIGTDLLSAKDNRVFLENDFFHKAGIVSDVVNQNLYFISNPKK